MIKRYYQWLLLAALLSAHTANAQITLNLALNSRPQPWLSDWANPINGVMIISFQKGPINTDPNVKIRTTLLDQNGAAIGISNSNAARVYTLLTGVNQFTIADALQLQNLILPGNVRSLLQRTGRLAAGQYQLMVEVINTTGTIVQAKQAKPFFVTSYQLPVLIAPANDAGLDARIAQSVITFRWTNLVPGYPDIPNYRVQVFEILPGQTPMQAFRGNRPILDEPATQGATQFVWHTALPMLDSTANKRFIWTVQTLDAKGQPIPGTDMSTQGRSEPAVFNMIKQTGVGYKKPKD